MLDEVGGVHAVPKALHSALVRGEVTLPSMAGQTLRLVRWDVRLKAGAPGHVVNRNHSLVRLDARGRVDQTEMTVSADSSVANQESAAKPTAAETHRMAEFIFGESPSPGSRTS